MTAARSPKPKAAQWDLFSVMRSIRELWTDGKLGSGTDYAMVQYVWEQTWAKQRTPGTPPPEWARLTLAQIAKAAGLKGKNATDVAQRYIGRLKQAGILATRKEGRDQVLFYKLTPDQWAAAPKYEPKPIANVLEMPLPDIDEEADDDPDPDTPDSEQQAIPGLEHIALATQHACKLAIDTPNLTIRHTLSLRVGIDKRIRGNTTELIIREENKSEKVRPPTYRSGGKSEVTEAKPPTQQVGGQKSRDAQQELMSGMLTREHPITPQQATLALKACAPCRDVAFILEQVDRELESCAKKRKEFDVRWLWSTIAAHVRGLWPQVKDQARRPRRCQHCGAGAEAQSDFGTRCRRCGENGFAA